MKAWIMNGSWVSRVVVAALVLAVVLALAAVFVRKDSSAPATTSTSTTVFVPGHTTTCDPITARMDKFILAYRDQKAAPPQAWPELQQLWSDALRACSPTEITTLTTQLRRSSWANKVSELELDPAPTVPSTRPTTPS